MINLGVLLAALGIVILEMSEASAVAITISAETGGVGPILYTVLGIFVVMVPAIFIGERISYLPIFLVRIVSALLLLYFAQRLAKSARRSMKFQKMNNFPKSEKETPGKKGVSYTAFSVGAVESFEAAIVLVALFPESFGSTAYGIIGGLIVVVVFSFVLRRGIRKLKQGIMKVAVSSILFTFSAFWFAESVVPISDLLLVPLFVLFFVLVYIFSTSGLTDPKDRQV
ncbi:MAG: hypothetical protein QW597_04545 [Thermoplasmataceae archaeon]